MIIENTDAFYSWLISCLGHLCDADPAALAKYVMALLKKDKSERELKEFCSDQLDVFLAKQTKAFVDLLFETLRTRSYIYLDKGTAPVIPLASTDSISVVKPPDIFIGADNASFNGNCLKPATSSDAEIVPMNNISPVKSTDREKKKERDVCGKEKDFSLQLKTYKNVHRSRSSSSGSSVSLLRSRSRSSSHNTHVSREKRRRPMRSHRYETRHRVLLNKRSHGSSERREKERNRERREIPTVKRESDRQRSRSPIRSRSNSYDQDRSQSSSRSSCSRSRSWSREHSKEHTHGPTDSRKNKGSSPDHQSDHGDKDYRVGACAKDVCVQNSPVHRSTDMSKKHTRVAKRCKDYDEKGFCMQGDLCVYDHGTDPLVVENVSVLNFNASRSSSAPVAPSSGCVLPSVILQHQQASGSESPLPPLPPASPPPPPPPPPLPPPPGTFAPEPYNPEAPGMFQRWATTSVPPPQKPGSSHSSSGSVFPLSAPLLRAPFSPTENPAPGFHANLKLQRTRERELIGVLCVNKNSNPIETSASNVDQQKTSTVQRSQSNIGEVSNATSVPVSSNSLKKRKLFDYGRLGGARALRPNVERCTLELRKIPRNLNTLTLLVNHFSKFGSVRTIVTRYDNDPEAALVEFTTHVAAAAAYRDSEPVLNNRFIKVFWHNNSNNNIVLPFCDGIPKNVLKPLSDMNNPSKNIKQSATGAEVLPESVISCVSDEAAAMCALSGKEDVEEKEKTAVCAERGGIISRTVFNPAVRYMKKNNILPSSLSLSASLNKKCKEEQLKEVNKKRLEFHKKKQSLLHSHVESQKMLLDKLAKSKIEKEKVYLKKMIEELCSKITNLQSDLKKECEDMKELCVSNTTVKKNANGKLFPNPSKTEAEKELLDAEIDLYNRSNKGDDVTDLMFKVNVLKQEHTQTIGLFGIKTKSGFKAMRGGKNRGREMHNYNMSIDNRPRKFLVMNVANVDIDTFKAHFSKFGEIESFQSADVGIFVTYRTRKEAEAAFMYATKCNSFPSPLPAFNLVWCHNSSHPEQLGKLDLAVSSLGNDHENELLEEEEEEEEDEDSEARSWRR